MLWLASVLLLTGSPETERMLLGPSPFFRREGLERAVRAGDWELVARAARSIHWDARRLAAGALGPKTPPQLLKDPVSVVREAAARALDRFAPRDLLVELLKDHDDAVRAAAAWALRDRRATRELKPLLRDPSPTVRYAALAAMGRFNDLLSLSKRSRLSVSVPALAALGRCGGASVASQLVARLSRAVKAADKSKMLLYYREQPMADIALARAVGDLARREVVAGGKPIGKLLGRIIDRNPLNGSGGILLAEAVAGARDAEAARRIIDAQVRARKTSTRLDRYFDPAIRGVLHAFSREPWSGLAPLLYPLLDDRDLSIRLAVIEALHGDAALPGLRDGHAPVRVAALERVMRLKAIVAAADDGSPEVQRAVATALGRIGDPAGAKTLEKLLQSEFHVVRHAAVAAMLRIASEGRVDLLYAAATTDDSRSVRGAAGAVLAFLDDPSLLPRVIGDLEHERLDVRGHVIALLRTLTPARLGYEPSSPAPGARAWREWWQRKEQRRKAHDAFRYHVEDLRRKGLDLVLVIDATGSMAHIIQATKRRIQAVVERLRDVVPNLRVRIVAYRDKGDAFLTMASPLTHDPRLLEDYLACIPAAGGGDAEEAVLAGLRRGIETTRWRNKARRVVLLFGDAGPHEEEMTLLESTVREFKGTIHTVNCTSYSTAGGQSRTSRAFAAIANWSKGSFLQLRAENDLLRAILVLALGPAHKEAIEALFGL